MKQSRRDIRKARKQKERSRSEPVRVRFRGARNPDDVFDFSVFLQPTQH